MTGPYDDIINLPHHVSDRRPRMPRDKRAAQFSPFAALTGYDAAIGETARLTGTRLELDEYAIAALNKKLGILADEIAARPEVVVTHFQPDAKKEGGLYVTTTGTVKKIDEYARDIVLMDGRRIPVEDVVEIECALFTIVE